MSALSIKSLRAGYGHLGILERIDLEIDYGQWFVLLGPNGSGKTTLLNCIGARLTPWDGDIRLAGHSIKEEPVQALRRLGFVCIPEQLPALLSGRECLDVYAAAKGLLQWGEDIIQLAGELNLQGDLDSCIDRYSLGMRQKLCILLGLMGEPHLIVLDESFNGLDPASALTVKRHLRSRLATCRCALLLATHSLDIVEHCADRAGLLLDGRIVHEWDRFSIEAAAGRLEAEIARFAR